MDILPKDGDFSYEMDFVSMNRCLAINFVGMCVCVGGVYVITPLLLRLTILRTEI